MVHLYCGEGKGKTTAAMGLALRMAGRGKRVVVAQFLKGADSGERYALAMLPQVTLLPLPERAGEVDLGALLDALGDLEMDSLLLEGGGTLNWSFLEQGLVQSVCAYIAPKLLGGASAKSPVEGTGVPSPQAAFFLKNTRIQTLGEDILLESEVDDRVYGDR